MSVSVETTGWFIKLYSEINLKAIQQFFIEEMKKLVKFKPVFTLVIKNIFDGKKAQKTLNSF